MKSTTLRSLKTRRRPPTALQQTAGHPHWALALGFECYIDDIANMFFRLPGGQADMAPVVSGSHMDTQPAAGRFDGCYGVLAALEALQAIDASGDPWRRPLEAVLWTNEEGCRFSPGCMGSRAFAEPKNLRTYLGATDEMGTTLAEALRQTQTVFGGAKHRPLGSPVGAFIETHIEQGPILEAEGATIGIVGGIQGLRWFSVTVSGEAGQVGTVPRAARKDAMISASRMISEISHHIESGDRHDEVRFTVGRLDITPNAPSTIPDIVRFSIDLRHPEGDVLRTLGEEIAELCQAHSGACEVELAELSNIAPTGFAPAVTRAVTNAVQRLGFAARPMISGAMHDAAFLAPLCPTGMVFVPCKGGVSHNEAESAEAADLAGRGGSFGRHDARAGQCAIA